MTTLPAKSPPPSQYNNYGVNPSGTSPARTSPDILLHQSIISPFTAALRAIPQHEKVEYLHALRFAPHLVHTESDPIAFLRYCDWIPETAARRLTAYWRWRVELFGQTRAFLPLLNDLSGNGALGSDELEILQSGGYCVMPNDDYGRPVLYNDRNSIPLKLRDSAEAKLKTAFYTFHILWRNPLAQTTGVVFFSRGFAPVDRGNITKRGRRMLHEALPMRVQVLHIVFFRHEWTGFAQYIVPFMMVQVGRFYRNKTAVHNFQSVQEAAEKLARHGLSRKSVPRSMGGVASTDGLASSLQALSMDGTTIMGGVVAGGEYQPQQPNLDPLLFAAPSGDNGVQIMEENSLGSIDCSSFGSEQAGAGALATGEDDPLEPIPVPELKGPHQTLVPHSADNNHDLLDLDHPSLDPTPIGGPTSPNKRQRLAASSPVAPAVEEAMPPLQSMDIAHLSDLLGLTASTPEGSPFEPSPIQSPTQFDTHPALPRAPWMTPFGPEASPYEPRPIEEPRHQAQVGVDDAPVEVSIQKNAPLLDTDIPYVETPEMLKRSLITLNEALNGLPVIERAAYMEATQRAPVVAQTEAAPEMYLRFESFNAWAAAKRLTLYWTRRVCFFGERAFMPLTQTMGGALWEEDQRTLAAGFFFFLPPGSMGRPVLCCDPSKRPDGASKASCIRVALYFFSILCSEYPATMTEGCVFLIFVSTTLLGLSNLDDNFREMTEIAMDLFPIKNSETHVIYSPSPTSSPLQSFTSFVLPLVLGAMGRLLNQNQVHFHVGDTPDVLERKLSAHGLSELCLQAAVNGGISDDEFSLWMKDRQSFEQRQQQQQQRQQLQQLAMPTPVVAGKTVGMNGGPPENEASSLPTDLLDIATAVKLVPVLDNRKYLKAMNVAPNLVQTGGTNSPNTGPSENEANDMELVPVSDNRESLQAMTVAPDLVQTVGTNGPKTGPSESNASSLSTNPLDVTTAAELVPASDNRAYLQAMNVAPDLVGTVGTNSPNPGPPVNDASSFSTHPLDITTAMELVPASEKRAYLQAMNVAADLVRKESDPARFLKLEKSDTVAAARRLAAYWRIRLELFRDDSFYPVDQTGDGALDRKDLALLQTGYLTQLPNDSSGCPVICLDGSRLERATLSSRLRTFFYMWSVVSQNELSATEGFTFLYTMTETTFDQTIKKALDLAMEAHPVTLKSFHLLCCCPENTSQSDFRQGPVTDIINLLDGSTGANVTVHICESRAGFARKLVEHGMSSDDLPRTFGGKWGLEDFVQWQELRIRSEWQLPARAAARVAGERYSIPFSIPPPPSSLNDDDRAERLRRMNVINSRRKRERFRIEKHALQEECSALRGERKELMREGRELEELLHRAEEVIASESLNLPTAEGGDS